jgi:hypothetical protein
LDCLNNNQGQVITVAIIMNCLAIFALLLLPVGSFAEQSPLSAVPIEGNPLAWLNNNLQCSDIEEQLSTRYSPFGTFQDLPEEKQNEVRKIYQVACSEKYSKCNFQNCKLYLRNGLIPSLELLPVSTVVVEKQEAAEVVQEYKKEEERLDAEFKAWVKLQADAISKAEAEEQEEGLVWGRFTVTDNPEEKVIVEKAKTKPENKYRRKYYRK